MVIRRAFSSLEVITDDASNVARELHAAGNRISNLSFLVNFRKLKVLDLRHNQLLRIVGVCECSRLRSIDLRDNRLESAMELAQDLHILVKLEAVDARYNPFSEGFSDPDLEVRALISGASSSIPHEAHDTRNRWRTALIQALPRLRLLDGLPCVSAGSKDDQHPQPGGPTASLEPGSRMAIPEPAANETSSIYSEPSAVHALPVPLTGGRATDRVRISWAAQASTPSIPCLPSVAATEAADLAATLAARAQSLCDRLGVDPNGPWSGGLKSWSSYGRRSSAAVQTPSQIASRSSVQHSSALHLPVRSDSPPPPHKTPTIGTSLRTPTVQLGGTGSLSLAEAAAAQAARLRDRLKGVAEQSLPQRAQDQSTAPAGNSIQSAPPTAAIDVHESRNELGEMNPAAATIFTPKASSTRGDASKMAASSSTLPEKMETKSSRRLTAEAKAILQNLSSPDCQQHSGRSSGGCRSKEGGCAHATVAG